MNRKQRRALKGKDGKGFRGYLVENLKLIIQGMEVPLCEGEQVKLDVDQIMGRKDYVRKTEEYRTFVESSRDKVFTVHLHRERDDGFSALIELVEEPKWLFWHGDLVRIENGG